MLVDADDAWSWGKFIFGLAFLILWNLIAIGGVLASLVNQDWVAIAIFGLLTLGGLVGTGIFIRGILLVSRLLPGEIVLPQFPLRLGETCQVRYRRQLRSGRTHQPGQVSATLICYEWVRYRVGTDTKTATQTVWEQPFPASEVYAGTSKIEHDYSLQISTQTPPSFTATNNEIRWELRVLLDLPGVAKDTSTFRLTIAPEVVV